MIYLYAQKIHLDIFANDEGDSWLDRNGVEGDQQEMFRNAAAYENEMFPPGGLAFSVSDELIFPNKSTPTNQDGAVPPLPPVYAPKSSLGPAAQRQ